MHTFRSRALLLTAAAALVAGVGVSAPIQPAPAEAATSTVPVRVASFNVQSVSLDKVSGNQRPWKDRRGAVMANILGEKVDVIGVQELNPSRTWASRLVDGPNQYLDLVRGLNKRGGNYRLTNSYAYNCVRSDTQYKCVYQYRGSALSDRILYNANTIERVSAGSMKYTRQEGATNQRYLAWAVLRVKATGSKFLFTSTHLGAERDGIRESQWYQMINKINALKGSMPVVSVGDFNTHRANTLSQKMFPAMKNAGYGDVLDQYYGMRPPAQPRAKNLVNGWINSVNHESKDVRTFAFEDRRDWLGVNIDLIFASNWVPVPQWKVVLNYDPSTLIVRGVLPSDHNMVRATLML